MTCQCSDLQEVSEDFQKAMHQRGSSQFPAGQTRQGATSAEEAPRSAADMAADVAARPGHPREQHQDPPDRRKTGAPTPAARNSLLAAIAAASGSQMGFQALLLPLAWPDLDSASMLFQQCMAALNAVQVPLPPWRQGMRRRWQQGVQQPSSMLCICGVLATVT